MILNLFKCNIVCVLVTYDGMNILYSPKYVIIFLSKNK